MKSPSDERKSRENLTCQSTPQLNCSSENENEKETAKATEKGKAKESDADESLVKREETCRLSTNALIPSSTSSLPGLTQPSTGPIDDKNEVCTCSFLISRFSSHSMTMTTFLPLDQDVEIIEATEEISFRLAILLFLSSVLVFFSLRLRRSPLSGPHLSTRQPPHIRFLRAMSHVMHIMSNETLAHSPPLMRASTPPLHDRSLLSTLTVYAVRRHHSAPQQESRSQQVPVAESGFLLRGSAM